MRISQCNAPARGEIKIHLEEFMKRKEVSGKTQEIFRKGSQIMNETEVEDFKCIIPIYFAYNEESKQKIWLEKINLQNYLQKQKGNKKLEPWDTAKNKWNDHPEEVIEAMLKIKSTQKDAELYQIICDFSTRDERTFRDHLEEFHDVDMDSIKQEEDKEVFIKMRNKMLSKLANMDPYMPTLSENPSKNEVNEFKRKWKIFCIWTDKITKN